MAFNPDQATVPPGASSYERTGFLFLNNIENRMERIRTMLTAFSRQYEDWDDYTRRQKIRVIDQEIMALKGAFRGLAKNRALLNEYDESIADELRRKGVTEIKDYSGYLQYFHAVLTVSVQWLEMWGMLLGLQPPGENQVEVLYRRSLNSIKRAIVDALMSKGLIQHPSQAQFVTAKHIETDILKSAEGLTDA